MMKFNAYHNSHDLYYRQPFGAVSCGQQVTFRLSIISAVPIEACYLRLWEKDREINLPMRQTPGQRSDDSASKLALKAFESLEPLADSADSELFEIEYQVPDTPGLIWYYFMIRVGTHTLYYEVLAYF